MQLRAARRAWAAFRARRPQAADLVPVIGAGALVAAVSLWQWGFTAEGVFRALSLGTWMAVAAWIVTRRRRIAAARQVAEREALRISIARELHDTIAGHVAAIGIQAAAARRVLPDRPADAAVALERIEAESRTANADLRRMLEALRSGDPVTAAGARGLADLPALVEERTLGRAGATTLAIDPAALAIGDPALDQAAFRIVEEAVRNAAAHAGPVPVHIRVAMDGGTLQLEVVNGPGRPGVEWPGSGLGLAGMRERASLFGGTVVNGPLEDGGFRVVARLPVPGAEPGS